MSALGLLLGRVPLKVWVAGAIAALIFTLALGLKLAVDRADRAEQRAQTETIKAEVLDRAAAQTATIQKELKAREDEVDKIPGADAPLPPGFGADLERVRRGERDSR